ncbi:Outer membrane protein TolC [Pedobacter westerhofensis]|uniref:Outer membrane protein TolC n=1 Tax=Pedobacter westerhofensis TaxID=425512 RepID=A0A521BP88_9SPHI|nr:Outer membrane protein TolC [Pedobacter westerhofensis]
MNFGLRGAKVGNAVASANLQQADFNKELYVLKLQLSKLYFNILKNTYQLHIDQENIRRYQSVMTIVNALSGSGIKPGVDSSMARAELSKVQISYNTHEGAVKKLQQQLSFLTGISASEINLDTIRKDNEITAGRFYGNMNDTVSNPLISYYNQQHLLYKSAEKLVRKSYLPKIILAGGVWERGSSIQNSNYRSLDAGLGYQRFTYGGGIAVTYDLFNIVHRRNKLSVSHFQTQAAEFQLRQQKQAISSATAEAVIAVSTAENNLRELPQQLKAAQAVYSQKVAQYKAGVIDLIDLTNASFLLYTSQLDYVETLNEWYQANLEKAASTGNLDQFIQTIKR